MLPLDFPAEKKNALLQTVNRNFFILLLISLREGIFIIFSFTYFALSKESIFIRCQLSLDRSSCKAGRTADKNNFYKGFGFILEISILSPKKKTA